MSKRVYVNAWEYVNPGPSAGGGGFDWYHSPGPAQRAYGNQLKTTNGNWGHFYFSYTPKAKRADRITAEIDAKLHDLCARAFRRHIGPNVFRYWKANNMKMGGA